MDETWYLNTYPDVAAAGIDPVQHYLQQGWREGRDPRPDFSTRGYLTLHGDLARAGQNPLIHHLRNGATVPHAATDDELARGDGGVDEAWYLKTYPDVAAAGIDPVRHYLQQGWREGRDPRSDFSTRRYLTLHDGLARAGQNPLIHHLRNGGTAPYAATDDELARGDGGVDETWYLNRYPDVAAAGIDPVRHYLQQGWREGRDPRSDFSTRRYLTLHDDIARAGQNPLIHHLRNGGTDDDATDDDATDDGGTDHGGTDHGGTGADWHGLWRKNLLYPKVGAPPPTTGPFGTPGREKLLFVGHEATRTGAPLILLTLMEAIERLTGAELFLVLERDGPLLDAYRRVAHVLVNREGALYGLSLHELFDRVANPGLELAICNTADTWRFMAELRRAGMLYIVSLVHERMSHYDASTAQLLHASADRVVFPAQAVKQTAVRFHPQYGDAAVVPQGLLNEGFGRGDKTQARRAVRAELGLAEHTKIVLGCGVREPRKGLDLFVQLAARARRQTTLPVHFIWVGGDNSPTSFKHFVEHDIAMLGLGAGISLVAETADPERYFLAADAYALTSRDDPFPCVVQEAMACALPVLAFEGAGGAAEALADGCGIMVPYLDLDAMERQLRSVLARPADFASMRRKAQRRVRSTYQFAEYARLILDIASSVRSEARKRRDISVPSTLD